MNLCGYALAVVKDASLLPMAGYFLCAPLAWKEDAEHTQTPILLIHGSGFNQSEWVIGRHCLSKQGRKNVYSFNWDNDDSSLSIEHYTTYLEKKIDQILTTRQDRDIILIGHSMGGLMAGYYTEVLAKRNNVNVLKVITIATPWQGTSALKPFVNIRSALGFNEIAKRYQQMLPLGRMTPLPLETEPENLFLLKLTKLVKDSSTPYVTFGSYHDLMVPYPSCHLPSASLKTTLWGLGHYSIIISPTLWKHICSELQ